MQCISVSVILPSRNAVLLQCGRKDCFIKNMSKKDYKKENVGRKQFSIDRIKFHDSENADELFGYNRRYQTPPETAAGGFGMSDIPQRSSEDPTAEFVGPFEADTQPETAEEYSAELADVGNASTAPDKIAEDVTGAYADTGTKTDPYGSWTGRPDELSYKDGTRPLRKNGKGEEPVQDADDL